jgi:MSHA biogenesis protein MshP
VKREAENRFCGAQRGFSIVTAIFLIVVLAGLGSCIVQVVTQQQASSVLDVSGSRAYQAARAGIEWGAHQVLDPNNTLNPGTCSPLNWPATCAATTDLAGLAGSLAPFTVTVLCAETPATEGNRDIRIYQLQATACNQPPCPNPAPATGYVERRLTATLSKCKDSTAAAPRCACG